MLKQLSSFISHARYIQCNNFSSKPGKHIIPDEKLDGNNKKLNEFKIKIISDEVVCSESGTINENEFTIKIITDENTNKKFKDLKIKLFISDPNNSDNSGYVLSFICSSVILGIGVFAYEINKLK